MTSTLKTTHLGEIRGKVGDGVVQYLGIKYATLRNRLASPQLVEQREDGSVLDATQYGPSVPSAAAGPDMEMAIIQKAIPGYNPPQSETECLNLNITVPSGTTTSSKLPVFVFIHGGGFFSGSASYPTYEFARFTKLAVQKQLPIIAVSLNYRVGIFGFLTSRELRDAGYRGNNGLRDQKTALQWVQKHISDFGGDPDNVTLAGESAGGASSCLQLYSEQPLFKRLISISGTPLLPGALPEDVHEERYKTLVAALGLGNASPEERLTYFLDTPISKVLAQVPRSVPPTPVIDDFITGHPTLETASDKSVTSPKGKQWCQDLMIGSCQMDGSIMGFMFSDKRPVAAKEFLAATHACLGDYPSAAQILPQSYGITEDADPHDAFIGLLNFCTDISFLAPVLATSQGWVGNAYVYFFNEPNPWDGPWKGHASHVLDVALLFGNWIDHLEPGQLAVADAYAEDIFKFVHGIAPFPAIKEDKFTARVYGPSATKEPARLVNEKFGDESMQRETLFKLGETVPLDRLAAVREYFQSH